MEMRASFRRQTGELTVNGKAIRGVAAWWDNREKGYYQAYGRERRTGWARALSLMGGGRNDCQRISRRVALTGRALALGAAAATVVSQATAQEKLSQAESPYND